MTDIPRHVAEPPLDTPIGEWWENHYDHFFVVLNPFFRVPGHHPATSQYGTVHVDRSDIDDIIGYIENLQARPLEAPDDFADTVKREGEAVKWRDIQRYLGADDFRHFAKTVWLWTVDGRERPDFDELLAQKLDAVQSKMGIYRPEEDLLPAVLEPIVFDYLFALGVSNTTIWNEWRDKSQPCPVRQFARLEPCVDIPREKVCAIEADGLLLHWAHDDVAGTLSLTDKMRAKANPEDFFEGFWVGADSYSDVFNPVEQFERKPMRPKN